MDIRLLCDNRWSFGKTHILFTTLPGETRFNHVWDALLYVMFIAATVSGLLSSRVVLPAIGLPSLRDGFWAMMHVVSATVLTCMIGIHVALHVRWVLARLKRGPAAAPTPAKEKS